MTPNLALAHSAWYYVYFARLDHRTGRNYLREGRPVQAQEWFDHARDAIGQARQARDEARMFPQTELTL